MTSNLVPHIICIDNVSIWGEVVHSYGIEPIKLISQRPTFKLTLHKIRMFRLKRVTHSVRTLNLDILSASCLVKLTSSKSSISGPDREPDVDLEVDRLDFGVPWLCLRWLGTCEALIT